MREGNRAASRPPPYARAGPAILAAVVILGLIAPIPAARATPWNGPPPMPTNLLFHLHNASAGVPVGTARYLDLLTTANDTTAPWNGTGAVSVAKHYLSIGFVVAPQLAAPLVVNGTLNATIYCNQSGSSPTGGSITLSVDEVAPTGRLTLLGTGPTTATNAIGPGGSVPTAVFLAGPSVHVTVPAADSLQVNISIAGNTAEGYGVWWGLVQGTYYVSTVSVPVSSYLEVTTVQVLNATGVPSTVLPTDVPNSTVTIVATISDPLGAYDFESFPVDLTIRSTSGTIVLASAAMDPSLGLPPPGVLQGTFDRPFNYSTLAPGTYTVAVNATDNTDHELVGQDTLPAYFGRNAEGRTTISVGLPPVPVSATVVDDHGVALPHAEVQVRTAGILLLEGTTNQTGHVAFDLSPATYVFSVIWDGVPVGNFPEAVTGSPGAILLDATVIYPTFRLVTGTGEPLAYALVTVVPPNGTVLPLLVGNGSGEFSLTQVPAGNYSLTVIYEGGEVVAGRLVPATSDGPIVVVVGAIYPLTVHARTSTGSGLEGVFVSIVNRTSGATVAAGITDGGGTLQVLLPAGVYVVTGHWSATYYLSPIQQTIAATEPVTNGTTVTLRFSKAYPAFTSTNEFFLILGYAVLTVLLVVLVSLVARRRKRSGPAPPVPTNASIALEPATGTAPPPSGPAPPGIS